MKLRELLDRFRMRQVRVEGDGQSAADALAGHTPDMQGGISPTPIPPNYVPSQQDDRPHH